MSRGNERHDIVRDDGDRRKFLEILGRMCTRLGVEVHAYVLMNNHYHLLLRTPDANLSRSMQWFAVSYTRYFNLRHRRSGHLFQGRFKSFLVENDAYLMQLSCYIHRNPIRAGAARRLSDYRWSSYPAYAYGRHPQSWLTTGLILSVVGGANRQAAYRRLVQQYAREERQIWEDVKHGILLGSDEFAEKIRNEYLLEGDAGAEVPQRKRLARREDLQQRLATAANKVGLDLQKAARGARVRQDEKEARDVLLYVVWESGQYTNNEIGAFFGLCYSAVSRRAQIMATLVESDPEVRRRVEKVKSLIKM